jgi:two-component system, sensor histidine kinase and response regulator
MIGNSKLWNKLTGDPAEFSMENRVFNYVCVTSFVLLIYGVIFDLGIVQYIPAAIIASIMLLLVVLYYYSRFKKKYQTGIVVYAVATYLLLILNYFTNFGINGPTISLFFLTFNLLITIGKPKHFPIWISMHIGIVVALVLTEYLHPEWIPYTYRGKTDRFLDIIFSYSIAIIFIFTITNYLRRYFLNERSVAKASATAISEQNKLILEQFHQLEQVNAEKNKLFSIVSHDLKSPLDSIMGYLTLMSEDLLDKNERAELENQLLTQTKYTSDLLLNLLSWAKTQMEGVNVHLAPVALKGILETVTNNKVSFAARKGVKVTHSIDPTIEVVADKDMLTIVIRNLVNNAIKFTKPGGEVYIKAIRAGGNVELSVQDNGIGIPVEKQDEIFTLKTQSTYGTNNEKGIGLGLRMCKEFMEYQHGRIFFESKEGVGSVFYISLPVAKL